MNSSSLPERGWTQVIAAPDGPVDGQIQTLITLLLTQLLDDTASVHALRLIVHADQQPPDDGEVVAELEPGAARSLDGLDDAEIRLTAALSDGQRASLVIGPATQADRFEQVAQRYLGPIVASLNLNLRLHHERSQARAAVEAVEQAQLLDLATGVVMARQGGDARSARATLAAWSARSGIAIGDLTAENMLELLTGEEL